MSRIEEVTAKLDALEAAVVAEHDQVNAELARLDALIEELRNQTGGIPAADVDLLIGRLEDIKSQVENIVTPLDPPGPIDVG